ncbi:MAG: NAD(P)H-binding protein [Bacteroidota bacterium]
MTITKNKKTAIIFGASGLVGGHCLQALLQANNYEKIISFGRRKLPITHEKLVQKVVDFEDFADFDGAIEGDDVFICLGTTRAKAGKDGFIKVDFEYSFNAAKYAAMNGANQLILVSSVGADKDSFFLYPKTKGQLEEAVKRLPFWAIHILQPSLLLGDREETRIGEQIATKVTSVINRFTDGMLGIYTPIEGKTVGKAMVQLAQGLQEGVSVHTSAELIKMVEEQRLIG